MGNKRLWLWMAVPLICVISLVLVFAVVLGSRPGSPTLIERSSRPSSRIFEGFAYAGQDLPSAIDAFHVNRFLPMRLDVLPMPTSFVQGHEYFFHHPLPPDDGMRIAQEVLAPRLRAEGYALTETVNGIFFRGFATWELKGRDGITTWGMQFKRDKCVGIIAYDNDSGIRSNPWPVVRRTWDPADYILKVEGSCTL
jgi:hypothetical protein